MGMMPGMTGTSIPIAWQRSRNAKKTGDIAAQIEQRVKLDGSLPASKRGPGKQRETQIDGRRIESIDRPFQIDSERLVAIKFSRAG